MTALGPAPAMASGPGAKAGGRAAPRGGPYRWRGAAIALTALVLTATAVADLVLGPSSLAWRDVVAALAGDRSAPPVARVIVWDIRLPATLMAMVVGAALGIAGALMQTILGNPLASPYTLGFSAAAGVGAAAAMLFGLSLPLVPWLTVPVAASIGAGLAAAIVYGLARMIGSTPGLMILIGIAVLFLFQSVQSLLQYLAAPEVLQAIVFWLFGSLTRATWLSVGVTGTILACSIAVLLPALWPLTALTLGDARARALGIPVEALRRRVFLVVALLTAGAVAFVGTIGFVGLVAPHLARLLVGDDQRFLLPMSGVAGALVLTSASVAAKTLAPGAVIPIGIVTALVGVPFLFALTIVHRGRM